MANLRAIVIAFLLLLLGAANALPPPCEDAVGLNRILGHSSYVFIAVFVGVFGIWSRLAHRSRSDWVRSFLVLVCAAVPAFIAEGRIHRLERLRWSFDGIVADKYRAASNHSLPAIRLAAPSSRVYMPVATETWSVVKAGDHIVKARCSYTARVNGIEHRFVP